MSRESGCSSVGVTNHRTWRGEPEDWRKFAVKATRNLVKFVTF